MSGTLLVVADTDSYVKWGAALASQLPQDAWRVRVVVLATPAQPSARQLRVALAGSRFAPAEIDVVELDALGALVGGLRPEANRSTNIGMSSLRSRSGGTGISSTASR